MRGCEKKLRLLVAVGRSREIEKSKNALVGELAVPTDFSHESLQGHSYIKLVA